MILPTYNRLCIFIFVSFLSSFLLGNTYSQAQYYQASGSVFAQMCDASAEDLESEILPDFTDRDCQDVSFYRLDPQNRLVWIRTEYRLEDVKGPKGEPLALFISAKMSGRVYLNGVYIGSNGRPGMSRGDEKVGRMDTTIYAPQSLFQSGANQIDILASSHAGFLHLYNPVHDVSIRPAQNITHTILNRYWPSLMTLGLFILGWLYFSARGVLKRPRVKPLTFSLMCLFAAGQLISETFRGLMAYSYPVHEIRLIAIVICSAGFGLTVAFHVLSTFKQRGLVWIMAGIFGLVTLEVFLIRGFDGKALFSLATPLLISLILSGYWTYQKRDRAFIYFIILLIFTLALFTFEMIFLDVVFFYLVALFLILLLTEQGISFARESRELQKEQTRAERLQMALDQAKEKSDATEIIVKSAGKIEHIPTDKIIQCRGADGYSELILQDGREVLHAVSLSDLENNLPANFLRVHRSHLINTSFVQTLTREVSGTGTLKMRVGGDIPVSRRIMPQVRQVLG
jgi:hypothetical protein